VLTARIEITDWMLIFGQRHLRAILAQYEAHYNGRRLHRSLRLQPPGPTTPSPTLPRSGSSAGPSSVASSTNMTGRIETEVKTGGRVLEPDTSLSDDTRAAVDIAVRLTLTAGGAPCPSRR